VSAPAADVSTVVRRLPPVTEVAVVALALIVGGGIDLASYLPRHAPLGLPIGLVAAAGALLAVNAVSLARIRPFAWERFFFVGRRALLAYLAVTGMLEYVFVYDGTRGALLVVLSLMLAVFAVDVPTIIAFTVARFERVPQS
jgi:hypothetical protein